MEYFERKINVFEPCYVKPIHVVQGSNMHEIRITIADWDIPTGATVEWQVATSTKGELNDATFSGNTIIIQPYTSTFGEAGRGYLQVRIKKDSKVLVSFAIDVFIQPDRVTTPTEGSNSDVIKVLVDQYVQQFSIELQRLAQSIWSDIRSTGDEVIQSIPSDYTELESRVDELETAVPSGITLSPLQKQTLMDMVNIIGTFTVSNAQEYINAFNDAWNISVTGIRLNKANLSFDGFGSETLIATLIPSDATGTITWTTSNAEVATVANGLVEVVDNGNCTITASCSGYTATCAVTVTNVPQRFSVVSTLTNCSISNTQSTVFEGSTYSATLLADAGYEMSSVVCTMGGVAQTVTDGSITISNVTGNIEITAVAEKAPTYTSATGKEYTKVFTIDAGGETPTALLDTYGLMENLESLTLEGALATTSINLTLSLPNLSSYAPNLKRFILAPSVITYSKTNSNTIKFLHYAFNGIPQSLIYIQLGSVNDTAYWAGAGYFRSDGVDAGLSNNYMVGNTNGLELVVYTDAYKATNGGFNNGTTAPTTTIKQYLYTDGSPLTAS